MSNGRTGRDPDPDNSTFASRKAAREQAEADGGTVPAASQRKTFKAGENPMFSITHTTN